MTALKRVSGTIQHFKILLFFSCLLIFTLASLILLCASPAPEASATPFSLGVLLDGTFLEKNGVWSGILERDVLYDNQIPPQLLLNGGKTVQLEIGNSFVEPGYFSQDARGNILTDRVEVRTDGDQIIYTVTDDLQNATRLSRTITYVDTTPPNISLTGTPELHIPVGGTYTEPGYIARDKADGTLTDQVVVSGTVDTSKPGTYVLTYTACDSAGNQTMVERTVYVDASEDYASSEEIPAEEPSEDVPET